MGREEGETLLSKLDIDLWGKKEELELYDEEMLLSLENYHVGEM